MTIIGNLGGDPEMRYLPSGEPVTSFNVAVNERRRQQDGTTQESTLWFRVSCWSKLAEVASTYLQKGRSVYVEGTLSTREFQGNDGKTRFSLEIRARELQMLDRAGAGAELEGEGMETVGAGAGAGRQTSRASSGSGSSSSFGSDNSSGDDKILDDIPF
jgi:single-strand DNA-binding protein